MKGEEGESGRGWLEARRACWTSPHLMRLLAKMDAVADEPPVPLAVPRRRRLVVRGSCDDSQRWLQSLQQKRGCKLEASKEGRRDAQSTLELLWLPDLYVLIPPDTCLLTRNAQPTSPLPMADGANTSTSADGAAAAAAYEGGGAAAAFEDEAEESDWLIGSPSVCCSLHASDDESDARVTPSLTPHARMRDACREAIGALEQLERDVAGQAE